MPALIETLLTQSARTQYDSARRAAPPNPFATRSGPTIGAHRAAAQQSTDLAAAIAPLCKAICFAHDRWRQDARFDGLQIDGPIASGGRLVALSFTEQFQLGLRSQGTLRVPDQVARAVATGLGEQWSRFTDSVRVPGLPWYPTFAAVAGPVAPPTPNVPTPLASCAFDRNALSANALEQAFVRSRRGPAGDEAPLFKALAKGIAQAVDSWIPSQLITNVLGTGPVPSFSPPVNAVGPVVGGHVISTPGHLAT